eukprot:m.266460 g.266460  ORF g.266460 m.266460 type:complete len:90 (+) comp40500_c0_seq48:1111-1380(+)
MNVFFHFPSITSFTAQLLLNSARLIQLLSLSLDDLTQLYPSVPIKVLKYFALVSTTRCSAAEPLHGLEIPAYEAEFFSEPSGWLQCICQ